MAHPLCTTFPQDLKSITMKRQRFEESGAMPAWQDTPGSRDTSKSQQAPFVSSL